MFYVSKRIDSNHFCVVDTSDNVEETYSADELKEIAKTIDINGVGNEGICPVKTPKEIVSLLMHNDLHLAVSTMPFYIDFGIRLKSKPTGGEMTFVHNRCVNFCRKDVNNFILDSGSSKSTQLDVTLDDVLVYFSQYQGWTITEAKRGRY